MRSKPILAEGIVINQYNPPCMQHFLTTFLAITALLTWSVTTAQTDSAEEDFYTPGSVREIRLTFDGETGEAWQKMLDSMRLYGSGQLEAGASVDGQTYKNVGVSIAEHRGFSVGGQRNPLIIRLDHVNKSQNHQGYVELYLSPALRDPSMIREVLGYEIAREYMAAPGANFAKLYVNDEYRGLFVNIESVDHRFAEHRFGPGAQGLFHVRPADPDRQEEGCMKNVFGALEYDKGGLSCLKSNFVNVWKADAWANLLNLTSMLADSESDVSEILHIDNVLWMLAFNNVLVNLSSYSGRYSQNYALAIDRFGKFHPVLWNLNYAFGSYKNTGVGSDLDLKGLQTMDPMLHKDNRNKPLISALLSNPLYRNIYLHHMRTILADHFSDEQYEIRAAALQELIAAPFAEDPYQPYSDEEFATSLEKTIGERSQIPGIVQLMSRRARFLSKHPLLTVVPPEFDKVDVKRRKQYARDRITDFTITASVSSFPRRVFLYYRPSPDQPFQMVQMMDDGLNEDGAANDQVYGITIDPEGAFERIEYFILAENAASANFYPARYRQTPASVSLSELN